MPDDLSDISLRKSKIRQSLFVGNYAENSPFVRFMMTDNFSENFSLSLTDYF